MPQSSGLSCQVLVLFSAKDMPISRASPHISDQRDWVSLLTSWEESADTLVGLP